MDVGPTRSEALANAPYMRCGAWCTGHVHCELPISDGLRPHLVKKDDLIVAHICFEIWWRNGNEVDMPAHPF